MADENFGWEREQVEDMLTSLKGVMGLIEASMDGIKKTVEPIATPGVIFAEGDSFLELAQQTQQVINVNLVENGMKPALSGAETAANMLAERYNLNMDSVLKKAADAQAAIEAVAAKYAKIEA